jgi:hypothetical protein
MVIRDKDRSAYLFNLRNHNAVLVSHSTATAAMLLWLLYPVISRYRYAIRPNYGTKLEVLRKTYILTAGYPCEHIVICGINIYYDRFS